MQWHFPFGEKVWFEFQETSQFTNGTASPGIYEHKNNLAGCVQILGNFKSYQEFSI